MKQVDLVIIGTGPAGDAASLYASRAGLSVVILESNAPGGRLVNTAEIENYPGTGFIKGVELAMKLVEQAKQFGAEMLFAGAVKIEEMDGHKIVHLSNGENIQTKAIIIATGTRSRGLDEVKGYKELLNKGVSHCIVCDGAFSKDSEIAVIGGGNSATEETLFANKLFKKITILNSFPDYSVIEGITYEKLNSMDHVKLETNANVLSINGADSVESVTYEKNGEEITIDVKAVFVYVGNIPNTEFIKESHLDILDGIGYVETDENMSTRIDGIFGAGDVIVKNVRQISTAIADGTIAAISAKRYIDSMK